MKGDRSIFLNLNTIEGGIDAFDGIGKGKITDMGKIDILALASRDNVLYSERRSKI